MWDIVIAVLCLAVCYFARSRWSDFTIRSKMGLSGPRTCFWMGNLLQLVESEAVHETLIKWRTAYGNTFGYYVGSRLFVAVHDLDTISDILIKNFHCFSDRMLFVMTRDTDVGKGLLFHHGNEWKQVRSLLAPTFSTAKIKQMQPVMAEKTDILMNKLNEKAASGESFDIHHDFQGLTLDVIGKCALAIDCNCQLDPNDTFLINCRRYFNEANINKSVLILIALLFPGLDKVLSKFIHTTEMGKAEHTISQCIKQVMEHRKQNYKAFRGVDLLQLMLQQSQFAADNEVKPASNDGLATNVENEVVTKSAVVKNKGINLSDDAIRGNSFTFLVAGYETTSTALGYTSWLLAKFPEKQKLLQDEIDQKVNEMGGIDQLDYDTIHKLPYLDAVMKESLRYLPPVANFVARTCVEECTVRGMLFKPGVQVLVPVYTIHHDPEIWHNPESFLPERFLDGANQHSMAWLPFGGGPRNCIGMRFAILEYKLCLARLMHRFTIEKGDYFQDPLNLSAINTLLRPVDGIFVKLTKRSLA